MTLFTIVDVDTKKLIAVKYDDKASVALVWEKWQDAEQYVKEKGWQKCEVVLFEMFEFRRLKEWLGKSAMELFIHLLEGK